MSGFDWRSPVAYANMKGGNRPDFAWECLRRNDNCRSEYRALPGTGSPVNVSSEFRRRWGLSFRG
jgi:hypothetical protein